MVRVDVVIAAVLACSLAMGGPAAAAEYGGIGAQTDASPGGTAPVENGATPTATVQSGSDISVSPRESDRGNRGQAQVRASRGSSAGTADEKPILVEYGVDFMPGSDQIELTIDLTARGEYPSDHYLLSIDAEEDLEVVEAEGFEVSLGSLIEWNESHENATVRVRFDPTQRNDDFGGQDFGAGDEWALFEVYAHSGWENHVEERFDPAGFRGREYVLLGEHERHSRSAYGQDFELIVPATADLAESPSAILDTLVAASRYLRVGQRTDEHYHFVATDPLRGGGRANVNNREAWTSDDSSLWNNVWTHEYVHTRQGYHTRESVRWLSEAEAEYFEALVTYKLGTADHPTWSDFRWFRESLAVDESRHGDVVLADEDTWAGGSDYRKGALVVAALDAEIRQRTDGRRSYVDVMRELNRNGTDSGWIDHEDFADAVERVAGEPMDGFLSRYVRGDEIPDVPDDSSLYVRGEESFDVAYQGTATVDATLSADPPAVRAGEPTTVNVTVTNAGTDAAVEPELAVDVPTGWEVTGTSVAEENWTAGNGTASTDVFAPGDRVRVEVTVVPERPSTGSVGVTVTDADGNEYGDDTAVTAVEPPTASAWVEPSVVRPGTTVPLNASVSTADGDLVTYEWDLDGDGTFEETTEDPVIERAFATLGEHTVDVRVTDEYGLSDSTSVTVTVNDAPTLSVPGRSTGVAGEPVALSANVTDEVGDATVTWRFPDGSTEQGATVERAFAAGTHEVTVVAADDHGARTNASVTVAVEAAGTDRRGTTSGAGAGESGARDGQGAATDGSGAPGDGSGTPADDSDGADTTGENGDGSLVGAGVALAVLVALVGVRARRRR